MPIVLGSASLGRDLPFFGLFLLGDYDLSLDMDDKIFAALCNQRKIRH